MLLHLLTWQEVEARLARVPAIVIPIGSTEQHGPNGLLGTDAICPEVIAREAGEAADILVGPTFNVGMAQHHLAFPGTISLRPATMMAVLQDWIASLSRHGFRHIYFLNGHGGNISTIEATFSQIYADASFVKGGEDGPRLRLVSWWQLPGIMRLSQKLFPEGMGSHATPAEVAVTYYAYPEAQKSVAMSPRIAPTGTIRDAEDYRRQFPDGRIGSDPSTATPEAGRTLVQAASQALIADFQNFLNS